LKNALINFGLLIVSFIIIALALEVLIRIFNPMQDSMKWFKSSKSYGYELKKNFSQNYKYLESSNEFVMRVKTNSFGHRYKEYDTSKFSNDKYKKIMLLGDSFIFGHGVNMEDHMAHILDSLLMIEKNEGFVVINAGVGGWGTIQQVNYAIDNFTLFNPDFIFMFFCANDPLDDIRFNAGMRDNEKGLLYFPGKIFLRNNSHLYRFLFIKFKILLHQFLIDRKIKEKNVLFNRQSGAVITDKDWENTERTIKNFSKKFKSFNKSGKLWISSTAPWDEKIRTKLKNISKDNKNLFFVDLYDETVNLSRMERRLPHDGHWSKLMHKKFAEKINTILN